MQHNRRQLPLKRHSIDVSKVQTSIISIVEKKTLAAKHASSYKIEQQQVQNMCNDMDCICNSYKQAGNVTWPCTRSQRSSHPHPSALYNKTMYMNNIDSIKQQSKLFLTS